MYSQCSCHGFIKSHDWDYHIRDNLIKAAAIKRFNATEKKKETHTHRPFGWVSKGSDVNQLRNFIACDWLGSTSETNSLSIIVILTKICIHPEKIHNFWQNFTLIETLTSFSMRIFTPTIYFCQKWSGKWIEPALLVSLFLFLSINGHGFDWQMDARYTMNALQSLHWHWRCDCMHGPLHTSNSQSPNKKKHRFQEAVTIITMTTIRRKSRKKNHQWRWKSSRVFCYAMPSSLVREGYIGMKLHTPYTSHMIHTLAPALSTNSRLESKNVGSFPFASKSIKYTQSVCLCGERNERERERLDGFGEFGRSGEAKNERVNESILCGIGMFAIVAASDMAILGWARMR